MLKQNKEAPNKGPIPRSGDRWRDDSRVIQVIDVRCDEVFAWCQFLTGYRGTPGYVYPAVLALSEFREWIKTAKRD